MKALEVKVRPVPNNGDKLKGASRIYINKDALLDLTGAVENGRPCFVETAGGDRREATLWAALDGKLGRAVAQMSRVFQDAAGLKLGDQCRVLFSDGGTTADAQEIVVENVSDEEIKPLSSDRDLTAWSWVLESYLGRPPSSPLHLSEVR